LADERFRKELWKEMKYLRELLNKALQARRQSFDDRKVNGTLTAVLRQSEDWEQIIHDRVKRSWKVNFSLNEKAHC
jgi:hypothetical protein